MKKDTQKQNSQPKCPRCSSGWIMARLSTFFCRRCGHDWARVTKEADVRDSFMTRFLIEEGYPDKAIDACQKLQYKMR